MESLVHNSYERKLVTLFDRYQGQSIKVENLLFEGSHPDWIRSVLRILRELEIEGKVYVERHPRIEGSVLRSNIRDTDIIYFDTFPSITRKTLLYQTKVEYGDYTINHLLGCAHGCLYPCYAMNMSKRWGRIKDYEDWIHPRIVSNALDLLDRELPKTNGNIQFVHLSFMTDPFMHDALNSRNYPWVEELTLNIIKKINSFDKKVTLLTKGILPISLTDEEYSTENEYGITLVSLDDGFHSEFEPYTSFPRARLKALEDLHDAGLKTWVSLEPYPTPNIIEQDICNLLAGVSFVDTIIFGKWNYSALVNGHDNSHAFYLKCADEVVQFCEENTIRLHIKEGTPKSSNKTNSLFE
ncbi:MAG: radical SAM protein [Candidatus Thorarchaeota archaeon]